MPKPDKPRHSSSRSKSKPRTSNARSESVLSRRSSQNSFITAAGVTDLGARSTVGGDSTDGLSDPDLDSDQDSSASESPGPRFARRESGDSFHRSPPTSQDDAATLSTLDEPTPHAPRTKKHLDPISSHRDRSDGRGLLSPSSVPRRSSHRDADRFSRASHLTLPYEHSEAGDYSDGANRRESKSSRLRSTHSSSKLRSQALQEPFTERRKSRSRSFTDGADLDADSLRIPSRLGKLAPPLPNLSLRNSFMSGYAPSSPGSEMRSPRSPTAPMRSPLSPHRPSRRQDRDDASIATKTTAKGRGAVRGPGSVIVDDAAEKVLDPENHVFPGTKIRKYIEPPLTDAMRDVLRQFSGRNMGDHGCSGYPIAVFVGATALDTGSLIRPHISGGISLYFGAGHPKNMAVLLPDEDRIPRHIPNPKAPTPISLSRRAELRAVVTALKTIFELYRGKACAHICIDSAYVAKAWATWIPTWEAQGWPGDETEESESRIHDRPRREDPRRDDRRDGGRSGYSSEGGRPRRREPRHYDRDDFLDDDPYDRRRSPRRGGGRRDGGYASDRGSRRGGGRRRRGDYTSDSEDYSDDYDDRRSRRRDGRGGGGNGGRGRRDGDGDRYDLERDEQRWKQRGLAEKAAKSRKLVDEDLLRELAEVRYKFAQVEVQRLGSAHLYLIDRTHNPADRMARAVAKSEGGLLAATADHGVGSEPTKPVDDIYEDDRSIAGSRVGGQSRTSRLSIDTVDRRRRTGLPSVSSRQSLDAESRYSNATEDRRRSRASTALATAARGRPTAKMKDAGTKLGGKHLSVYEEEDEVDEFDTRSVATYRSNTGTTTTRAELERDNYLARQAERDDLSRHSRLAPPSSLRFRDALGSDGSDTGRSKSKSQSKSKSKASGRESIASQARFAASQPDLRSGAYDDRNGRSSFDARRYDYDRDDVTDRGSMLNGSVRGGGGGGGKRSTNSRSRQRSHNSEALLPPSPSDFGSVSRASLDSRTSRGDGRSRPRDRPAAPEEDEFEWDRKSTTSSRRSFSFGRKPHRTAPPPSAGRTKPSRQREWTAHTAEDLRRDGAREAGKKKGKKEKRAGTVSEGEEDRRSIFSRIGLFGRRR